MKKLILSILSVCAFSNAFALSFGNPSNPEMIDCGFFLARDNCFAVKTAYQRDNVSDRKMKALNLPINHSIDRFTYVMDQGIVTINFADRYEVYGSVGAFKANFSNRPFISNTEATITEYETKSRVTWGIGGRGVLFNWGKTALDVDVKYQYANPVIEWLTADGSLVGNSSNGHLRFKEWQAGIGLSHHVDIFVPYIGGTYAHNRTKVSAASSGILDYNTTHFKMKNAHKFGMVLGCGLTTGKLFSLNIEAAIISEEALRLTGEIKF